MATLLTFDQSKPWAKYFNSTMASLPNHVKEALTHGPHAPELLETKDLTADGYLPVETGYTLTPGGGMIVACLTDMPGVKASDWEWWFGWCDDSTKYKLWHPLAHVDIAWQQSTGPNHGYIGRTSLVTEYVGAAIQKLTLQFVEPQDLGITVNEGHFAICGKIRAQGIPCDTGILLHYIRPTEIGCEVRTRFWIGGEYIDSSILRLISKVVGGVKEGDARSLLVHGAHEMNHLAGFLAELRNEFDSQDKKVR